MPNWGKQTSRCIGPGEGRVVPAAAPASAAITMLRTLWDTDAFGHQGGRGRQLEESFRIVTVGLKPGQVQASVARELAALFKCSRRDVSALLAREGVAVKKGLSLDEAARYMHALDQCGLATAIVPERPKASNGPDTHTQVLPVLTLDAQDAGRARAGKAGAGALACFALVAIAARSAATMAHDGLFYATCAAIVAFSVAGVGCTIRAIMFWRG